MKKPRPTICLDFDGVIHSYRSPWQGPLVIPDPPTDGLFDWLHEMSKSYRLVVFSSRFSTPGAMEVAAGWMADWRQVRGDPKKPFEVEFTAEKPPAVVYIDDRAVRFDGDWSRITRESIDNFRPWNR